MRKKDRDGIVDLIASVEEALDYCKHVEVQKIGTLYEDCSTALVSILNTLRRELPASNIAFYQAVIDNLEISAQTLKHAQIVSLQRDFVERTVKSLSLLTRKLRKEIVQYEVVFLPYQASMWDSMESIWMAAKNDPRCICYVIPIPYFDKNRDGTLGKMHYEGELLPNYVPITHYDSYDIVNRRPDIIYFHNPYDMFNKVTSVHPLYYSSKLRTYTSMLVYVPYFIVMSTLPEDYARLPGVINADYVIVQSEQIAEEYRRHCPELPRDNFHPLGSPKLDKVLEMSRLKREELELPEEWKKKILNKKVVLYNTHLNNLMNHGEEFIKKLRYVFACFKNREDVVLLWRPHPLSESTIAAMNPIIMSAYQQIIDEYKMDGFGIFDDTPELHRSVALADAYYGDRSSLIPMFSVSKKPIMQQNIGIVNSNNGKKWNDLDFYSCYQNDDEIWFAANDLNGLFRYNIKTGENKFIAEFPHEERKGKWLFSEVHKFGDKLIFVPRGASHIAVYDLSEHQIVMRPLEESLIGSGQHKYLQAVRYGDLLYLIPAQSKAIVVYNMMDDTIKYDTKWYEALKQHSIDESLILFRQGIIIHDATAYIPSCASNIVMELDMLTCQIKLHRIDNCGRGFSDIVYINEYFYLIPRRNDPIIKCKYVDGLFIKHSEFSDYPKNYIGGEISFAFNRRIDDNVYLFPLHANMMLRFNINTGVISEFEELRLFQNNSVFYSDPWKYCGEKQMFFSSHKSEIIGWDEFQQFKAILRTVLPKEWDEQYVYSYIEQQEKRDSRMYEYEWRYNSLNRFFDYIVACSKIYPVLGSTQTVYSVRLQTTAGDRIHKYLMDQLYI